MFRCPYCFQIFSSFSGLVRHVGDHLSDGECPVCLERFSNIVQHARRKAMQGGKGHQVLYGLIPMHTGRGATEFRRRCGDLAYEVCEVKP